MSQVTSVYPTVVRTRTVCGLSHMSLSLTRPRRRGALLVGSRRRHTTLSNPHRVPTQPACRAGPACCSTSSRLGSQHKMCRHSYQSSIVQHPRCTNPQKLEAGELRYLSTIRATSSSSPMVEPPALLPVPLLPLPPHLPHLRQGAPEASPGANALLRARGGASGP